MSGYLVTLTSVSRLSHGRSRRVLPVAHVASEHLGEAVAPEEAAQHHARLPLAPLELLRHADGTDGHGNPGAVQEAGPEQQHDCPNPRHRPARLGGDTSTDWGPGFRSNAAFKCIRMKSIWFIK